LDGKSKKSPPAFERRRVGVLIASAFWHVSPAAGGCASYAIGGAGRFEIGLKAKKSLDQAFRCPRDKSPWAAFRGPNFNSPNQQKLASIARGRSKRRAAMTGKVIVSEFVLPTAVAIVLGVLLSVGAVYLFDYLLT
jgi:hypothetical protein